MYALFLKSTIRYLRKNKLYSFINIIGLAIGIASFVLIMLYVNYEQSYDTFEGSENIYRVYMDYTEDGVFVPGDAQSYSLSGPALKEAFPEIKEFLRLSHLVDVTFMHKNTIVEGERGALADPSVFDVLNYSLLRGDVNTALKEPYTILLTASLARKIFGDEDPIGKSLSVIFGGNTLSTINGVFTVNGVLEDFPKNTHMKNDFLIPFNTFLTWNGYPGRKEFNWSNNDYFTYIEIDKNADVSLLKKKIMDYKVESLPYERHNIEPLEDIHLHSDKPYEAEVNGSAERIRFLWAIGLIIIILSWLNYINLSTVKSLDRAKEMGIRKVAGAQKSQLILQSLFESLLLNSIAIAIAIVIVWMVLPVFNNYIGNESTIVISTIKTLAPIIGFILLGTLVSGIYPAFILSNYTPVKALKGKIIAPASGINIRRGLIVGQFLATIILLIGTFVVTKQIRFLQEQPIGADLDQIVALNGKVIDNRPDSLLKSDLRTLENELQKLPFIKATATADTYPGGKYGDLPSSVGFTFPDGTRDDQRITYNYTVDPDYFKLMDLQFLAGGPFLETAEGHSNKIVMNEKFARHMGISDMEHAIDKTIKFWGKDWTISGVIKDYHHFSLKTRIEPMLLRHDSFNRNILVKLDQNALSTTGISQAISRIGYIWKEIFPQSTFNYTFLDENFEAQYKEEKQFGLAFGIFTSLAIFIAMMGLFGLTAYSLIRRKKEVGIRKVLGASVIGVIALLSKDFIRLVLIAVVIAIPIAWYAMDQWLQGFAYRIALGWWMFALAGLLAVVIALLTVSFQSLKAALMNPVESLRSD